MRIIFIVVTLGLIITCSGECTGGPWGKLFRESVEQVSRKSAKAAREGAEAAARKGGSQAGTKTAIRGTRFARASDEVAARVVGRRPRGYEALPQPRRNTAIEGFF